MRLSSFTRLVGSEQKFPMLFLNWFLPTRWRAGFRLGLHFLRSLVFCPGSAVTAGTRHLCWEEQSLGNLLVDWTVDLHEGIGTCTRLLASLSSPLQRAQLLGAGISSIGCEQVWFEGGLSLTCSCQCRYTFETYLEACCAKTAWWVSVESEDSNLGWSSLHLIFEVNKMKSLLNSSA